MRAPTKFRFKGDLFPIMRLDNPWDGLAFLGSDDTKDMQALPWVWWEHYGKTFVWPTPIPGVELLYEDV